MNNNTYKRAFILLVSFIVSAACGIKLSATAYTRTVSSGTHTVKIITANDGTRFKVISDGTELEPVYDDLGAISVSGGQLTFTINTPNLIWFASNGKFSVTGSGKLTIVQDPSITGNSVFKRPTTNLNELVNVNGANANLTITGNGDESRIVFNGNGKFSVPVVQKVIGSTFPRIPLPSLAGGGDGNIKSQKAILTLLSGNATLTKVDLIHNYNTSSDGGAISFDNTSKKVILNMNGCSIINCLSNTVGAAIFFHSTGKDSKVICNGCKVFDCFTYANNSSTGGGCFRAWASSMTNLEITECEFYNNYDNYNSVILWNSALGGTMKLIRCKFHDNFQGALDIRANADIQGCEIYNNYSCGNGGGMSYYSVTTNGAPSSFRPTNVTVTMDDKTKIYNNIANKNGGGIYFQINAVTNGGTVIYTNVDGGPIETHLMINGAQLYNNKSGGNGGCICITKTSNTPSSYISSFSSFCGEVLDNESGGNGGAFYISGGVPVTIGQEEGGMVIYNNKAKSGGAIYVSGSDVMINKPEIGKVSGHNEATNGNGGALFVAGGNVEIYGGDFKYNDAKGTGSNGNGGSFYVENGNVTFNSGEISSNTAQNDGGGLYIKGGDFTINGGEIESNTATRNGGGAYVSGGAVTFNGNIHDNNAAKGAGLYLAGGADMTYTGGIMTANNARVSGQAISNTAYWNRSNKTLPVEGCGGGIYLENGPSTSKKTSLIFEFPEGQQTFGLYGNTADKAGQEILAEGHFTDITLPAIANMKLAGFEGQDANPNWYQDYFTDDSEYGDNVDEYTGDHHAVTNRVSHIDRYKTIMSRYGGEFVQHLIPDETLGNIKNKYLAITLGFSMLDLTVTANGLLGGETALVKLIRYGSNGQKTYDVMLKKGENETAASKTLINMPWGTYSIIPNNSWNWHYEPIAPMTNIRIGDAATHEITLDYHHNSVAEQPLHYDVHD